MTRSTITIRNDFHRTETRLRVQYNGLGHAVLTPTQIQRARKALCGMSGCCCNGPLGERGPQDVEVVPEYSRHQSSWSTMGVAICQRD